MSKKLPPKPCWIIAPEAPFLKGFNVFINILSLPITVMHIFIVAFGFAVAGKSFENMTYVMEAFFGFEILLNFFTSYKDLETF